MRGPPSAPHTPRISLSMTDEDVVSRVANLWGTSYHASHSDVAKSKGWKVQYATLVRGKRAVEWMKLLRPHMFSRRQIQIDKALSCYKVLPHKATKIGATKYDEVRQRLKDGARAIDLAEEYGVSSARISQIKTGYRS